MNGELRLFGTEFARQVKQVFQNPQVEQESIEKVIDRFEDDGTLPELYIETVKHDGLESGYPKEKIVREPATQENFYKGRLVGVHRFLLCEVEYQGRLLSSALTNRGYELLWSKNGPELSALPS